MRGLGLSLKPIRIEDSLWREGVKEAITS